MRRALLAVTTIALFGACAIQPDSGPRDIPVADQMPIEPVAPDAGASAAPTASRVFLLTDDDGEPRLRSVTRDVDPPTHQAVLEELVNGPNPDEIAAGFSTALPDTLTLDSARPAAGTLNVDVSSEILTIPRLQLAVAEIVFTANELPGVREVRLLVDGEQRAWPDGRGELQTDALTVYDFPGLAESTQPSFPAIPSEVPV